jgi:MSHA biogenesis protein MshQ
MDPLLWMRILLLAVLGFAFCLPCWAGTETVRDEFNDREYSNNDGTQSWTTNWSEIGESNGPTSGDVQVRGNAGEEYVLRIADDDRGAWREADLSGATSATLSFDYRRNALDGYWDYVAIEVSSDGGANWTELDRFRGPDNDSSYQSVSYDISSYIASETRIRLISSSFLGSNDRVYFDNIQIAYQVPDTPQLVAHYALEGDVADSSGNGHTGGSQGTVDYERAVICDGVQLDGNGYVSVPDNNDFDLRNALTVTAWIRADSLSVSGHEDLYSFLSKDTNYEFHVRADGSLYWWWSGGSFDTDAGVIEPGTWYHFAAVYSKSDGIMRIYLNGEQEASHSWSSSLPTNSDPLYIGTDKGSGGGDWPERRFHGSIDEVRIYNYALTQAEVMDLVYETDSCGPATPVAEWRFDECDYDGSGALAEDTQGSHDATAQGTIVSAEQGQIGRAAELDADDDYFEVTGGDVPLPGNWTVSTWFKWPMLSTSGSRYHVVGSMADGDGDILWLDRGENYRWGTWVSPNYIRGSYSFSALISGWHHLVAVGKDGWTYLYVDGDFKERIHIQATGDFHYVGISDDFWYADEGFRTALDEYLVFDGALNLNQIHTLYQLQSEGRNLDGTLRADILCGSGIDHFEIIHDGSALTCVPETVTVRACADDAEPCTLYSGDVEVTLSPTGWVDDDTQTLTGGSGTVRLRHTKAETVTLAVSSSDPAADNGYECVDGSSGSSCELAFHEAGFLFDVPDVTSCAQEDNIVIAAVRADATAEHCVGLDSFAGTTRSIAFWSGYQQPDSGTRSVYVNTTEVADASPGTAVNLTFDGNAESSLSVRYADAGQVQLTAHFEGSGDEAGLVMEHVEGSDTFIAVPAKLLVSAEQTDGNPLNSTDPDGSYHIAAGEDFYVTVSGACADNTVTPNFAAATTLKAVTPFQPATGRLGDFTPATLAATAYSAGVAEDVTATYSEVGTVTLQAVAADYLGTGTDVTGTSATIGRFTPYHFAVSLNSPEFATGCATGGFTYIGQPFGYATAPVITVTAQNKQNETTENYEGEWWKMASGNLTEKKYPSAAGTLVLSGLPGTDPTVTPLIDGMGLVKFSAGSGLVFERDYDPVEPFDADIALKINVLDGDDIAATANPVTFGEATAGGGMDFDNGKEMRWGRLAMQNAYGSERVALAMPLRAEYYSGSAFVPNNADGCTGLALSKITLSNSSGSVTADNPIQVGDSGSSSASLLNNPMVAGEAGLSFSASGDDGYIDVQPDLSSMAWLQYDWDGDDSHDDNPTARASFGLFKGRPALIYLRENYRAE